MMRIALSAAAILLAASAASAADLIDPTDAHAQAQAGETLIIDVRTPQEWEQTGVPPGAFGVNLYDPGGPTGFLRKVMATVGDNLDQPVALICRTGRRSAHAAQLLESAGFTNVADVAGGVAGASRDAPGWAARGLPLEPCAAC